MSKIKLLIVDDSALIRKMLTEIFLQSDAIEVVGTANDPMIARNKIKSLNPDVLTLDVEMPKMDGLTFLRNLMRLRPMPVVMISAATEKGAEITLKALELGAVDFVAKPKATNPALLQAYADEIIAKVIMAANATVTSLERPTDLESTDSPLAEPLKKSSKTSHKIIAIGSSTGGTKALKDMVAQLPANAPAIVVAQHLPAAFSVAFAKHIDEATQMKAAIAQDGQRIEPGHIYIAPGDHHLRVVKDGEHYYCQLDNGPVVNRHRPSVEVLFKSIAENVGDNAIGVMLTGMGADGAEAMKTMRDAGAINIAQDQASSIVWGMPGKAVKAGATHFVLPLDKIAAQILALAD
jgi:two-component system chemotaxis response regulator CheB